MGAVADIIGPINAFLFDSFVCTVLIFCWMGGIHTQGGIIVFCLLYGFCSAGLITLPATIVAVSMCPDMRQYGYRMTIPAIPLSIGILIGNPIAGAILPHGWLALQSFAGVAVALCTLLVLGVRFVKVGINLRGKC